ncbi:unnamed protein product [Lactuca saligna]|uniref:Uncharacterized protein n=1 Tax=Lactuca saligna TaxID=75948 RepID=A0AA36EJ34_LACSI|nr:unnamed protein product [Lactuca saligna]
MALHGCYRGKLCHREVDIVKALPLLYLKNICRISLDLFSAEGGNYGSSGPTLPSQPVVGVISLAHFSASAFADMLEGMQAKKGTTPIHKKQSLHVVLSSDEETKSDDAGLRPLFVPGQKELVVVPSSSKASPSLFTGSLSVDPGSSSMLGGAVGMLGDSSPSDNPSMGDKVKNVSHPLAFEVYAPSWAVTKDFLLSEGIIAQEWSSYAHPPATMKFLAAQSGARMADDF